MVADAAQTRGKRADGSQASKECRHLGCSVSVGVRPMGMFLRESRETV